MAKWPACLAAGAKLEDEEPCTSAAAATLDCFAPALFLTCATQQSCKEDGEKKLWVSITNSMSENQAGKSIGSADGSIGFGEASTLLSMAETCGTVVGGELPKELKFGLDDPEI